MFETLNHIDTNIFLFLNGLHTPFWDVVMWWASEKLTWIPLYALVLWLLLKQNPGKVWLLLLMIVLLVLISDQAANLSKYVLARPRPSHEPALRGMVHLVRNYAGGNFSFYSAHASSSFAVAVFAICLSGRRYRWLIPVMLFYAVLVSYSRIYLGVHYPGDVVTGAVMGSLIGFGVSRFFLHFSNHWPIKITIQN
ncbi:MAG: phosphatase PAP2 family protein [Bacteroidales bacterium]